MVIKNETETMKDKSKIVLVVAACYADYAKFVRDHNLRGRTRYVVDAEDLKRFSRDGYAFVKLKGWETNEWYGQIYPELREAELRAQEVRSVS